MRLLYNILFTLFFLLSAPYYLWKLVRRGNWRRGFGQRFGRHNTSLRESLAGQRVLWLHAVSVGEANLCVQLINSLREEIEDWAIVVSTTTTTGMSELEQKLSGEIHKIYYPVDFWPCVAAAFRAVNPDAVVLVEAEIWPEFFWQAKKRGVPICLANARLSDKSHRGYRRYGFLFREHFSALRAVGAPTETDVGRLCEIGCRNEVIEMTGNMKFDGAFSNLDRKLDVSALLRRLGAVKDAPVLVGGSTHDGEERLLAQMFPRLKEHCPGLMLVIVPRHFERAQVVGEQLRALGQRFVFRSQLTDESGADCLVVDSTGELMLFYEAASVVFVGKSLTAHGGQNPIEPASLGRAIVFGPNMQNFRAVVRSFLEENAAIQVADATELEVTVAELLEDSEKRNAQGARARAVVEANKGATQRTAQMIVGVLSQLSVDVVR